MSIVLIVDFCSRALFHVGDDGLFPLFHFIRDSQCYVAVRQASSPCCVARYDWFSEVSVSIICFNRVFSRSVSCIFLSLFREWETKFIQTLFFFKIPYELCFFWYLSRLRAILPKHIGRFLGYSYFHDVFGWRIASRTAAVNTIFPTVLFPFKSPTWWSYNMKCRLVLNTNYEHAPPSVRR